MATNEVILSAKADLQKVISALGAVENQAAHVSDSLGAAGKDIEKSLSSNAKNVERFLGSLAELGRRTADQLRGDFKTIFSIDDLKSKLKGSNQLKGAVDGAVELNNVIRKVGRTLGMVESDFSRFQAKLVQGLSEIGLGGEEATRALSGIAQTQVRGDDNIIGLAKSSSQLASIGGQQGQEGQIAKGIADVVAARGGNVNDKKQLQEVAEATRTSMNVTGKSPTQALEEMRAAFEGMATDFRQKIGAKGMANVQAAGAAAGPEAQRFLETFMKKGKLERLPQEYQGLNNIMSDKGLDMDRFERVMQGVVGRIGFDPRAAARTLGLGESEAEGALRLYQERDKVKEAQGRVNSQGGNLGEQFEQSRGLGEALKANINKTTGAIAAPLAKLTQGATTFLNETAKTKTGAAAVSIGGGILASLMAGGGLYSILKGGGGAKGIAQGTGSIMKTAGTAFAAEQVFGQKTMPVYVVNMPSDFGGALGGAAKGASGVAESIGKLSKAADIIAKAGMISAAGALGFKLGELVEPAVTKSLDVNTMGKTSEGFEGNAAERFFFKMDKILGGDMSKEFIRRQEQGNELTKRTNQLLEQQKQKTAQAKRGSTGATN